MQTNQLTLNPHARWHVLKIGREQTRVLLIDDVFQDIHAVRSLAVAQDFSPENATYYPGVRAPCPNILRDATLTISSGIIRQAYGLPDSALLADMGSWLSLANTPPQALHALQCVPHFDSQLPTDFAIMLYVNDKTYRGTGFYRNNPTGYENITRSRWPVFEQARKTFEANHGPRKQQYFAHSDGEYTLMGTVDYRPNRMLVYPGTLLHSGLIDSATDLSSDPQLGRLTVNVFAGFSQ